MSRISRYRNSVERFIENRSCLSELDGTVWDKTIKDQIKDSDYTLPILMLTLFNSLQKKNNISFQGYHAASGIEFLHTTVKIINKSHNDKGCYQLAGVLISLSNRAIFNNVDVVKRYLSNDKVTKMCSNLATVVDNKVGFRGLMCNIDIEQNKDGMKTDIDRYLHKHSTNDIAKCYGKIKRINKKCLDKLLSTRICSVAELAVSVAWLLGGGSDDQLGKIRKMGKSFGLMYQIAQDFDNLEVDIKNIGEDGITMNYVANCGFQYSYEIFLENRQKFIEDAMMVDMFTTTLKEMVDNIETKVDMIIDATSPDIKSMYSSL